MSRFVFVVLFGFVSSSGMGCGSSTSDKPSVASLKSSGCKAHVSTPTDGDGRCVSWTIASNGDITFTLSDFEELCGVPDKFWKADASNANGELGLSVTWDFATANACGSCLQDFSFVVSKVPLEGVQRIRITTKGCTGDCAAHGYLLDAGLTGLGAEGPFCGSRVAKQ